MPPKSPDTGASHITRLLEVAAQKLKDKQLDSAWQICKQVLQSQSQNPVALHLLGLISHRRGKFDEAVDLLSRSVQINDSDGTWFFNCGAAAYAAGRFDLAANAYRQAISLQPEDIAARYQLAVALQADARFEEASTYYVDVMAREANHVNARFKLGCMMLHRGDVFVARDLLQEAVDLAPGRPDIRVALALALRDSGRLENAQQQLHTVIQQQPYHADAIALLASILGRMGNVNHAWEQLKPLIGSQAASSNVALVFAELAPELDRRQDAIELLQQLLKGPPLQTYDLVLAHFAVAKLLDQTGQYDEAFTHFQEANKLCDGRYDPPVHEKYIETIIETCNPQYFKSTTRAQRIDDRPVFIVGMPRSGTSLVEQILASHPKIFGAGELPDITKFTQVLPSQLGGKSAYPHCLADLTGEHVNALATIYSRQLDQLASGSIRITDKAPTNFLHLGLIRMILPGARIIHCTRDPVATCFSCFTKYFTGSYTFCYNLVHLGHYYRQYQRLMKYWGNALDLPVLNVRYEELVEQQEKVSRQLVDFCGLQWHENCLRFYETNRSVITASYDQVKKPLYASAINHWRHYQPYLEPLMSELQKAA